MNRITRLDHPTRVSVESVFLTAEWHHLAMLNYEVDPRLLLPFVPAGSELDCWNGTVFASLVGFRFMRTKLLGFLPIPFHSNFEEVNLRFYVRRRVGNEIRRGVVFIKEIVPHWAIAFVARTIYNENYVSLPMTHEIRSHGGGIGVAYRWRSGNRWNEPNLETAGGAKLPAEGSLEQFITEHYWGYAAQPRGASVEYRVTHPSWRVWQVRHSAFDGDTEELYGKDLAAMLCGEPESAFLAEGSTVTVMRGQKV
jgi:uncharacterized protein